ncbi:hypothetical protein LUZ63_012340 [Rhynchospora breviuscula]|uniref:KIB1-4 beta-propeller domain-containing protein n=1 Tax=Rhynchospora breviuscula TaxID=2022672 RepID=A0A9Q0CKH7_9POAL|nr:hypothetical protein LUZ63_012340 [Rhynchospora breviuscula]
MALCNIKDVINIWIDEALKLVNNSTVCWRRKVRTFDQEVSIRIWSELPNDILELVIGTTDSPKGYLHFIGVCKTWRNFAHKMKFCDLPLLNPLPKKYPLPVLLQPHGQKSEVYFYSIIKGKVHKLYAPEMSNKWIPGSWRGWLATVDTNDGNLIHLLNPITKAQLTLPPLPEPIIRSSNVEKIVVVSPSEMDAQSNCMCNVALITGTGSLHSCRIGDDRWKKIYPSIPSIADVVEFNGLLYAVDLRGTLFAIETSPSTKVIPAAVYLGPQPHKQYLVESSGDLLLISRFREKVQNGQYERTVGFKVYRLVESQRSYNISTYCAEEHEWNYPKVPVCKIWKEIESLHDQMLFVGRNCTLCLNSKLYLGCQENCIYFADDSQPIDACRAAGMCKDPHDNGVYYMNDKRVEYFMEGISDQLPLPAIWFSPYPW